MVDKILELAMLFGLMAIGVLYVGACFGELPFCILGVICFTGWSKLTAMLLWGCLK